MMTNSIDDQSRFYINSKLVEQWSYDVIIRSHIQDNGYCEHSSDILYRECILKHSIAQKQIRQDLLRPENYRDRFSRSLVIIIYL